MTVIVFVLPPDEVPMLATSLMALVEAKGQAAVDEALAALSMRQSPPIEKPAEE